MPPHQLYVETHAGGLSVLLHKDPEGVSEVVNDISLELSIFWRVLASETHFPEFQRIVQAIPFSEIEWERAEHPKATMWHGSEVPRVSAIDTAVAFFVRCRQSLAGRMKSFAPISRKRTRRGMNEQASAWINTIDGLPEVHERLRRVVVLGRDASKVIADFDDDDVLFYMDPPYLHSTRESTEVYEKEMSDEQHLKLCRQIRECKGKVLISGYQSEMYRDELEAHGWHRKDFEVANNAAGGAKKRKMIECVWANYKIV